MPFSLNLRATVVSLVFLVAFIGIWQLATLPDQAQAEYANPEYAALMGGAAPAKSGIPSPGMVWDTAMTNLSNPFYDNGPNDKGVGLQLGYSLGRVLVGFFFAIAIGVPLGFIIGMSPLMRKAMNPYIQIMKPISPLAWMPLALYTIKDASFSSIFVIFISSIWPILINTAHGVASVRQDWLNVARTLEVNPVRTAIRVILPAAAPTILTGMRISMGIAWLVIVAAEMLVGGTGIGYFVWNEWNNLDLSNVIFAIFVIGAVGMLLDMILGVIAKAVTYQE